ncbi:electron transport complex protein RnfE [Rodentibacter pneumotropicus]|uniref:Electron transport complex protein RnfE n=1 Tax=Rodentibacter pneumotropicus TaxID=758 RepID=A0A3S4U7N7_9PAST|nr:electron transport complex protein RnfE [Rodentibacter pneumotropicus]
MTNLTEKTTALLEDAPSQQEVKTQIKPSEWKPIFTQGIWKNNPAIVQLLGLCPLLAVSSTATNALGLGLATMLVLTCTNTVISLFRKQIPHEIRIPIYVMIIATTVTVVQLLMNAYTYALYQSLGILSLSL